MDLKEQKNNETNYECTSCAMIFESKQSKINHFRKIHRKKTFYKCDICEKVYSKVESIKRHIIYLHAGLPSYLNQNSALQEGVFLSEQIFSKNAKIMSFFEMK